MVIQPVSTAGWVKWLHLVCLGFPVCKMGTEPSCLSLTGLWEEKQVGSGGLSGSDLGTE